MEPAKRLVKAFLSPRNAVSGHDLGDDLGVVIQDPAPVCLDIGANAGQTIALLRGAFHDPLIHAFEPSTRMYAFLQAQQFGSRVMLHHCAVGSRTEQREFINYRASDMSSFLQLDPHDDNRFRSLEVQDTEIVRVTTIDEFIGAHAVRRIDLLKTDTQGYDLEVLRGADRSMHAGIVQNVLVELNFVRMYSGQAATGEITAFLNGHGFRLVDYYEKFRANHALAWCTAFFTRHGAGSPPAVAVHSPREAHQE
jgi:FkbM family methyltransferase